jgi:class 3 adenylate cyclase
MGVPSGTVTFLFTDIEGSTGLWELDGRGGPSNGVSAWFVMLAWLGGRGRVGTGDESCRTPRSLSADAA